jgi:replicative DNA helicase
MDKGLGGLNEDTLTVIAASTNGNKSLVAGMVGLESAKQGRNTLIVSTEQWPVIYIDRWAHVLADVSYEKGKSGRLSKSDKKGLEDAVDYLSGLPLMISYGSHTVSQIRDLVDKHQTELLIVDYVQLVEPDDRSANKSQQVAQVSHDIATLKGDLGIAVVNTAQLNRNPLSRKGEAKKPNMGDIHWSYEVVQDADAVVLMQNPYRDGVKNSIPGVIRLWGDKNRFGFPWWAEVKYKGDLPWLMDIEEPVNRGRQDRLTA